MVKNILTNVKKCIIKHYTEICKGKNENFNKKKKITNRFFLSTMHNWALLIILLWIFEFISTNILRSISNILFKISCIALLFLYPLSCSISQTYISSFIPIRFLFDSYMIPILNGQFLIKHNSFNFKDKDLKIQIWSFLNDFLTEKGRKF